MTIVEAGRRLAAGELSAVRLTEDYLERINRHNPGLNIYLEVFSDRALKQAAAADKRRQAGERLPPLAGIPLAIKDNILIKDEIASAASRLLAGYRASYDAAVITRLKEAGAVFLGRTNMDEFAMGSSTENSAFGPTKNPHDKQRVAGGSSGGSAAAVAAGLAPAALGSDTGGSVRQPASFCGVVGLKPTYGAVSRHGLIALASSLDQIGPLAQTVEDAALLFDAVRGTDPKDSTSFYPEAAPPPLPPKPVVGVPGHLLAEGVTAEVTANFRQGLERLAKLGFAVEEIALPHAKYALACYYVIMPAEAAANLARFDGLRYGEYRPGRDLLDDYYQTRGQGFGREPRRRILLGTYVLSAGYYDAYYRKAATVRRLVADDFAQAFKKVQLVATPTAPTGAFRLGENTAEPLQMYLADLLTVPASLAGLPAISAPSGKNDAGLPFGLQLIAPAFRENWLFAAAGRFTAP